jgi:hypothetical protein
MHRSYFYCLFVVLCLPIFAAAADKDSTHVQTWADKIKLSGDFRYRYEFIGQDLYNSAASKKVRSYDRNRNRLRLRLGLQAKINDNVDLYTRIASSTYNGGSGDPISTNQDLSGGFNPKPIWIDRAYVDVHPCAHLKAIVGRQPVPFEMTDELIWDADLNLEGVTALVSEKMDKNEAFLRFGGYWANEIGPTATKHAVDQGLLAGQIGGKVAVNNYSGELAVGYIDYGNVKDNPTLYNQSSGFGNSTYVDSVSGKSFYRFDYNMINVMINAQAKLGQVEPMIFFDIASNGAAKTDPAYNKKLNTAWLVGVSSKFKKMPIDWDFLYDYRVVQKDAVLGAFTFSDPAGGGTNYNGHRVTLGFTVLPNTRIAGTYMRDTRDPENSNSQKHLGYDRFQGDLEVKF